MNEIFGSYFGEDWELFGQPRVEDGILSDGFERRQSLELPDQRDGLLSGWEAPESDVDTLIDDILGEADERKDLQRRLHRPGDHSRTDEAKSAQRLEQARTANGRLESPSGDSSEGGEAAGGRGRALLSETYRRTPETPGGGKPQQKRVQLPRKRSREL